VLGVDRVGLAALTPDPPVGAVDLQDAMAAAAQVAGQPGTVGAGALYPEGDDLALGVGPLGELGVAAGVGGHGQLPQHRPEVIEGHGDVEVLVGVDTHDDLASQWLVGDAGHDLLVLLADGLALAGRAGL
jgi:hypothetical protein